MTQQNLTADLSTDTDTGAAPDILSDPLEPDATRALRLRLLRNGYEPIPLTDFCNGKAPQMSGWQAVAITEEFIRSDAYSPDNGGTGLRTGLLIGIDNDAYDRQLADEIEALRIERLGATPLRKVGAKGGTSLYWLADGDDPFGKRERTGRLADAQPAKVEVLALGQQTACFVTRPDGEPYYTWDGGKTPDDVALAHLPPITRESVDGFLDAVAGLLQERGYSVQKSVGERHADEPAKNVVPDLPSNVKKFEAHLKKLAKNTVYTEGTDGLAGPLKEAKLAFEFALSKEKAHRAMMDLLPIAPRGPDLEAHLWHCIDRGYDESQHGWGSKAEVPLSDTLTGQAALAEAAQAGGSAAPADGRADPWEPLDEAGQDALPEPEWLFDNFIEAAADVGVQGPPDRFKSLPRH